MNNFIYDEQLCFGEVWMPQGMQEPSFPNALNLGKVPGSKDSYPGEEFTNVDLRTVDVLFNSVSGAINTRVTVYVRGGGGNGDEPFMEEIIGTNTFTLEQMKSGPCRVAISPNNRFQYLRVYIKQDNGAPQGNAKCYLNTYAGK